MGEMRGETGGSVRALHNGLSSFCFDTESLLKALPLVLLSLVSFASSSNQ